MPANVASWPGKAIAKTIGSRYGAVDFPHPGAIRGDSRFQVFRWTEKPPAGGAANAGGNTVSGVRTVTPEGSISDFTRDGVFVRGTIKLDNGNTVEIGRNNADGKWASLNGTAPAAAAGRTLEWRELDSAKNVVDHGTRHFTGAGGKAWSDVSHTGNVIRHADNAAGDVVTFTGANRPQFVQHPPAGTGHVTPAAGQSSVTRNTMGQIVSRTDTWPGAGGGAHPVAVTGHGDVKSGAWSWTDGTTDGVRVSGRNERWTGSWDDSYRDYTTTPGSLSSLGRQDYTLVRDFRSLDNGRSLAAWSDGAGTWHSHKLDADGNVQAGSAAQRQWQNADGTWGNAAPAGKNAAEWRDVDPANPNLVLRESANGRVREYTNPRDHT
nr:hypothetical protein [Micromonospora sp. DSM 115978]